MGNFDHLDASGVEVSAGTRTDPNRLLSPSAATQLIPKAPSWLRTSDSHGPGGSSRAGLLFPLYKLRQIRVEGNTCIIFSTKGLEFHLTSSPHVIPPCLWK